MHINISVRSEDGGDALPQVIAGILSHISDMTVFLNTTEDSYLRFGSNKAPRYISWSSENRSQLIRIPAAEGEYRRAELRSPDPACNPYLAFALIIYAGLDGIRQDMALPRRRTLTSIQHLKMSGQNLQCCPALLKRRSQPQRAAAL